MYRVVAFILSLAVGGLAGWQVYINLNEIVSKWLVTIGISAGVLIVVTLLIYLPLLRHIADLIEEHFSTLKVRVTSRKTGVDLDAIPRSSIPPRHSHPTSSNKSLCSICGGPGGPICNDCHAKMSSK